MKNPPARLDKEGGKMKTHSRPPRNWLANWRIQPPLSTAAPALAAFKNWKLENSLCSALPYVPAGRLVTFDAAMLVLTLGITVGIGALAGVYPSWKASHTSPMEAIRNE